MKLSLLLAIVLSIACIQTASAITLTDSAFKDTVVWSGLTSPISVRFAPDGRVFVAQRTGSIYTYDSVTDTTKTLFATANSSAINTSGEMGLIGLAVDPRWPAQPYVYVVYVLQGGYPGGRLARFKATGASLDTAGPEEVLFDGWCQAWDAHTVDDLQFGPDGALYITAGDGADYRKADWGQDGRLCDANTSFNGGALRAQTFNYADGTVNYNAKMLRVDPDTGAALPDNPLYGTPSEKIIAHGFRNPFRFTIDPRDGDIYIADNGWNTYEEINYIPSPLTTPVLNFGWPCYEGNVRTPQNLTHNVSYYSTITQIIICQGLYALDTTTKPFYIYNHSVGNSVGGIVLLLNNTFPAQYQGALLFSDNIKGFIRVMYPDANGKPDPNNVSTFATGASFAVDLTRGPNGDIYYPDYIQGKIHRISYPSASISTNVSSGPVPLDVQFTSTVSLSGSTITYNWDLDGDGIFGDANTANPVYTYSSGGIYTVSLNATDNTGAAVIATTIIQANAVPIPVIVEPNSSTQYTAGGLVYFSGYATDPETGLLPPSALTWTWGRNDCADGPCHFEVLGQLSGVANGTFPGDDEAPNTMVLTLTADDTGFGPAENSTGLSSSVSVTLLPLLSNITLQSSPQDFPIDVLGEFAQTYNTTTTLEGVVDAPLVVVAPSTYYSSADYVVYGFTNWSNAISATSQTALFSITPFTLTALYTPLYTVYSTINVQTDIAGATVLVNGTACGVSPINCSVLPGDYELLAMLSGYYVNSTNVSIGLNETINVNFGFTPMPAIALIQSLPSYAAVFMDGFYVNSTDENGSLLITDIAIGTHVFNISAENYTYVEVSQTFAPNEFTTINALLYPLNGTVNISSTPQSSYSLSSGESGATPAMLPLAPGTYTITFTESGYQTEQITFTIHSLEESAVHVDLSKVTARRSSGGGGGGSGRIVAKTSTNTNSTNKTSVIGSIVQKITDKKENAPAQEQEQTVEKENKASDATFDTQLLQSTTSPITGAVTGSVENTPARFGWLITSIVFLLGAVVLFIVRTKR